MMGSPAYSVCSTVYNAGGRIQASLDSIYAAFGDADDVEVCVVDAASSDGTAEILAAVAATRRDLWYQVTPCKRGRGRQLAAEMARGEWLVVVDLDTVYHGGLAELIALHRTWRRRGEASLHARDVDILRRDHVMQVGGWLDLQGAEDSNLYRRLAEADLLWWTRREVGENWEPESGEARTSRNLVQRAGRTFSRERDQFIARPGKRLRHRLGTPAARSGVWRWGVARPLIVLAWMAAWPRRRRAERTAWRPIAAYRRHDPHFDD